MTYTAKCGIIGVQYRYEREIIGFHDVGKEIKRWVKFLVVVQVAPYVLTGYIVFAYLEVRGGGVLGLIPAALIIALGYFFARLGRIKLYAFGEIVDRVCSIEEHIRTDKHCVKTTDKVTSAALSADDIKHHQNMPWRCLFCEYENPPEAAYCKKCGTQYNNKTNKM